MLPASVGSFDLVSSLSSSRVVHVVSVLTMSGIFSWFGVGSRRTGSGTAGEVAAGGVAGVAAGVAGEASVVAVWSRADRYLLRLCERSRLSTLCRLA